MAAESTVRRNTFGEHLSGRVEADLLVAIILVSANFTERHIQ